MPRGSDKPEVKQILRDLDGVLPESVDRRNFLRSTVIGLSGAGLAGCSGDGDGDSTPTQEPDDSTPMDTPSGTDSGSDIINKAVTWRLPWEKEPGYLQPDIAILRSYFRDAGINDPTVRAGFGSSDTARRVGTGQEELGQADVASATPGLAEGFNLTMYGISKQRTDVGLVYRPDLVDDPTTLEGVDSITNSPTVGTTYWDVWVNHHGIDTSSLNVSTAEGEILFNSLASGDSQAGMQYVTNWATWNERLDVPLEIDPVYNYVPVPGFVLFANSTWLDEQQDGIEYLTRALEGFSRATKWILLHPEELVEIARSTINRGLQAVDEEQLITATQSNAVYTVSEVSIEQGLGYASEDAASAVIDQLGPSLVDNPDDIPPVEDVWDFRPSENADLATLSSDEVSQLEEQNPELWDLYTR